MGFVFALDQGMDLEGTTLDRELFTSYDAEASQNIEEMNDAGKMLKPFCLKRKKLQ